MEDRNGNPSLWMTTCFAIGGAALGFGISLFGADTLTPNEGGFRSLILLFPIYVLVEELVFRTSAGMPYLGPIWSQYVLYGLILGEGLRRGRGIWAIVAILVLHLLALGIIFVLVG